MGGGGASNGSGGGSVSGTLLKRMFKLADDGATDLDLELAPWTFTTLPGLQAGKPSTQWWDSMRQETCAYGYATDGNLRCLPTDYGDLVEYADDQCTQLAVVVPRPAGGLCAEGSGLRCDLCEFGLRRADRHREACLHGGPLIGPQLGVAVGQGASKLLHGSGRSRLPSARRWTPARSSAERRRTIREAAAGWPLRTASKRVFGIKLPDVEGADAVASAA